ncbi:MAG: hypothetical protein R8L07_08175 [Alphaproteobacteria bacterium]|nr:hypothetical protein [Alphaproteobacteria bacterium]
MFRLERAGYSCLIRPSDDGDFIVWVHDGQPTQKNVEAMFREVAALPFYRPDINCIDIWADTMDPSRMDPTVVTQIGTMVDGILKRDQAAAPPVCAVLDLMGAKNGFASFYSAFISEVAKANLALSVSHDLDGIAQATSRPLSDVTGLVEECLAVYYGNGSGRDPSTMDAMRGVFNAHIQGRLADARSLAETPGLPALTPVRVASAAAE